MALGNSLPYSGVAVPDETLIVEPQDIEDAAGEELENFKQQVRGGVGAGFCQVGVGGGRLAVSQLATVATFVGCSSHLHLHDGGARGWQGRGRGVSSLRSNTFP